jgi:hypothetical protein
MVKRSIDQWLDCKRLAVEIQTWSDGYQFCRVSRQISLRSDFSQPKPLYHQ